MSQTGKEIPKIEYLTYLEPDNRGDNAPVLEYRELPEYVRENARHQGLRIDVFWESEDGTVEEIRKARQLAFEFFVATADRVVDSTPQTRDLWADRYTSASIELFGAPEPSTALHVVNKQKSWFESLRGNKDISQHKLDLILGEYNQATDELPDINQTEIIISTEEDQQLALKGVQEFLEDRYTKIFDLIGSSDKEIYEQKDLVELFTKALRILTEMDDKVWSDWQVTSPKKGTNISINGRKQEIKIPQKRSPASAKEARKLLAHELLVHGLRAKNGAEAENEDLIKGYPSYLEGEEGFAILAGAAVTGEIGNAMDDRYIDIAFATGIIGIEPKKRLDLYNIVYARNLVRDQAEGKKIDEEALRTRTSSYVDRIFRGSPGDNIGISQAVYTADIYYYLGFHKMCNFIAGKQKQGHKMPDIFDYLAQGKFDPNNPLHVKQVGKLS